MNEEPIVNNTPSLEPVNKKRKILKILSFVVALILLLGAGGYAVFAGQANSSLKDELKDEQSKNQSLTIENAALKKNEKPKGQAVVESLPNNKKLTFSLSEDNTNIVWWAYTSSPGVNAVSISDKRVFTFLTTLAAAGSQPLKKACGDNSPIDGTAISLGIFDYGTKTYKNNQYANCLALLSDDKFNSDATARTQAQDLLNKTLANVKRFINESAVGNY